MMLPHCIVGFQPRSNIMYIANKMYGSLFFWMILLYMFFLRMLVCKSLVTCVASKVESFYTCVNVSSDMEFILSIFPHCLKVHT